MATLDSLQFEMERRVILFKPTTTMPDDTSLGYNADPNLIVSPATATAGEQLLYYSANGTRYLTFDASGNTLTEWRKKAQPNGWVVLGGDASSSIYGTDSSTWQLNMDASGVILKDNESNLEVFSADGSLATLIIGGLKISNVTGYLRAVDGSIVVDTSIAGSLTYSGTLPGDGNTAEYNVEHNLGSDNHLLSVYDDTNFKIYPEIEIGDVSDNISFINPIPNSTDYRIVIMGF